MMRKVKIFTSGFMGLTLAEQLMKYGIKSTIYTYSMNSLLKKSDSNYLRDTEEFPVFYIKERTYNPDLISLSPDDLILCCDWSKGFFDTVISSDYQIYVVHPSLLPKYRGYGAVSEQFLRGIAIAGVSIAKYHNIPDSGDIIFQKEVKIEFNDYPKEYINKCMSCVAGYTSKLLSGDIHVEGVPQNDLYAVNTIRMRSKYGLIDINSSAISVYNMIRAFSNPYFGSYVIVNNEKIRVWRAFCEKWYGDYGRPGTIINIDSRGIEIACGSGTILINKISIKDDVYEYGDIPCASMRGL